MRRSRISVVALTGLFGLVAPASVAPAQAWLPPAGEAFISIGYGNSFTTKHYVFRAAQPGVPAGPPSDNTEDDRGHIRSQSVGAELGYGITDRFAVLVGLPFTSAKWYRTCQAPHFCGSPHIPPNGKTLDDGYYHGTFQDYRVEALYQVLRNPVVLTPFVGAVIPSHDYQYLAHSAVGRGLREYRLGVNFGTAALDRILPGSYVQASYSYAFVERVLDLHHDRSNAALELGYFLTPSLGTRFLATGYYTHGGICNCSPTSLGTPLLSQHHDQIEHSSAISLGGGLSYQLTGSVDVYATYLRTVLGHGGHKIDHGISFGVSWGFSPKQVVRRMFGPRTAGGGLPVQL
jgi:opacity protein-like surface antigen